MASEYAGENLFDRVATAQDAEHFCAIADLSSPLVSSFALHEMGHIDRLPLKDRIYVAVPVVLEKAFIEADLLGSFVKLRGDGIVYDSVRHRDSAGNRLGKCAAVLRPPVLRLRSHKRHERGKVAAVRRAQNLEVRRSRCARTREIGRSP